MSDAIAAAEFRRFLKSEVLQSGNVALLFASHTLSEVEQLANRVAILNEGHLLACDTVATLKQSTSGASLEEVFLRLTGHSAPAHDGEAAL